MFRQMPGKAVTLGPANRVDGKYHRDVRQGGGERSSQLALGRIPDLHLAAVGAD